MEITYAFITIAAIAVFIVLLIILMQLSESRFSKFNFNIQQSSMTLGPTPFNPYDASHYPLEMFEEHSPYKSAGPRLTFYDEENMNASKLRGNKIEYEASVTDIGSFKPLSLVLGHYTKAEFYSSPNFRGKIVKKLENNKDAEMVIQEFKGDFKVLANSIRSVRLSIIAPYAIVYTEENNGGSSKIIRDNVPILNSRWNDRIESLVLSPFTRIKLYEHSNYRGAVKVYTNDTSEVQKIGFVGADFTDKTSSIQVESLFGVKTT
jgi:hypothetical protein